ncbi:MAG TPA: HDOD domain-containing protein [Candidatus Binatia bacterium]|jgi:HD-like signal output (HDOD) protein/ActR/RegA family two-component response regulator|nr:HDOD domain-containing protein [Candidatus Binatia bacterium]
MANKSILLAVADRLTLVDITQALGAGWEATSVSTEADAFAQLEKRSFDALVVDFNLGSPDGSELLNQAMEKRPETPGFLLAYEADLALVAAKVVGPHQILPKPIEAASLKSRIENGVAPDDSNSNQSGSEPATGVGASPAFPPVYSEVLKALDSPDVTNDQVGEIIARDAALTAEVLRLTNSAYLGLPRNLTDPVEAVASLGLETVKTLVMALRFLAEHGQLKPGYLSLEQIWQHSLNVGQIARDLVLFETKDRTLASQALAAGLIHDLGKVVLVLNFDDLYGRIHSLARKQPVSLSDIEKEMFGASHGEIGACLVGMWNLPSAIVEAAALHHEPPLGEQQQLTPLAAVHIANVLEHQLRPSDQGLMVAPVINAPFLNELGLLQRLPVWRAAFANRRAANPDPEAESGETNQWGATMLSTATPSRTANQLPGPAAATRTATSGSGDEEPAVHASRYLQGHWVSAGIAAGLLILLALWFGKETELNPNEPVYARTPVSYEAPAVVFSTLPRETVPPRETAQPVAEVRPAMDVSEEASATNVSSATVPEPEISRPAPEPTAVVAPPATVTNVPPPTVAPKEPPPPEFRLTGIIYTVGRPCAIMNGKTVYVGDHIDGATVISIGRTNVTLHKNGQRKTYALR